MTQIKIISNLDVEKLEIEVNKWLDENRHTFKILSVQFIEKYPAQSIKPAVMITYNL